MGEAAGHPFRGNQFTAVKGKTGEPLVLYHGSVSREVTAETLDPTQPHVRPTSGPPGIYLTPDARAAAGYMRPRGAGIKTPPGKLIAAHAEIKNPLNITKDIKAGQKKGMTFSEAKQAALAKLTKEHDGVIFEGNAYNAPEYVVFSNKQLRGVNVDISKL
jgi:hypothetical protein